MMHPNRSPLALTATLFAYPGGRYDPTHHWRTEDGSWCCSVHADCGRSGGFAVLGAPAGLRELAAALIQAADLADQAATAGVAEGVAG
jgi:hypothetical protein